MLNAIAPGAVSSATNPILDFWTQAQVTDSDGFVYYAPIAPYALSFQIWDLRNLDAPVQVFPVGSGTKHAVDPVADRIASVVGHYAAAWVCDVPDSKKGRYQIRWFFVPVLGNSEMVSSRDFDILPAASGVTEAGTGYALVSDLREECVGAATASDARLLRILAMVSRLIDRYTGRSFLPVYKTVTLDGSNGRAIALGEPLIALASASAGDGPIDRSALRVYNRHLVQNLTDPDDRNDPRLEFGTGVAAASSIVPLYTIGATAFGGPWRFRSGDQNVTVTGLFGYTEYDGSPIGRTPLLITQATKLMAMRELPKLGSLEREDAQRRYRLTSERTRDQSYTLAAPTDSPFTGDREVDDILLLYRRPFSLGSV